VERAGDAAAIGAGTDAVSAVAALGAERATAAACAAAAGASARAGDGVAVARRTRLGEDEFRAEYLLPRRPVILTDAASQWPLYGRATPDWFRDHCGAHRVRVLGQDCSLAELIDRLEASTPQHPAPYPCKFEIARDLRELLAEVSPRFDLSLPDRQASRLIPQRLFEGVNNLEIFFGGAGGRFPYLHYDVLHLHAWITQLHGDKEFILYAPDQAPFLYVDAEVPWQSCIRNHHQPDYARYPLLRHARAQTIVLRPGETLFLPCGWWHTARSLGVTISVAFDQLGADNWADFVADVVAERRRAGKPARAALLRAWLGAIAPLLAVGVRFGAHRARHWGRR
jgi:hypothetical protein